MENTTITRSFNFTLETIDFIVSQFDQLDEVQRVMGIGRSAEEQVLYDNIRQRLLVASGDIICEMKEAEKPKYEHRYAVRDRSNEVLGEHDSLNEAWKHYENSYKDSCADFYCADRGDFNIYDNKTQKVVTRDVPYFEVEYSWTASIDIELDGRSCDNCEIPQDVWDSIGDDIGNGDDYGNVSLEYGDTCFENIENWEEYCEEEGDDATEEREAD